MRLIGLVLALGFVIAPIAAEAQQAGQAVHTVGVLMPQHPPGSYSAFLEALRLLGYQQDRTRLSSNEPADGDGCGSGRQA